MFQPKLARGLAVSSALLALTVSAQAPKAPASAPDAYRSALQGYQPYGENKPVPWKEANDTVGRIGGWRAYAKEAAAAKPAASQTKP